MKLFLYTGFFLFLISYSGFSQSGCTDPAANNYNVSALQNDGSCTYTTTTQPFNLVANTPILGSNSGIEWINGSIYTFEDSGNSPNFYKIDTTNGSTLQTISVTNYGNVDWEDITADTGFVYIGDFGNNNGNRTDLRILKIKKNQFINNPASVVTLTAQAINFSYSDQSSFASNSSTNFDCESLISLGDSLFIFTKDRGDLQTRVYRLPKTPGTYTISPYTNYNVNGKITGADYNPINNEVILIGYMSGDKNSFIWYLNNFQGVNFFSGNKRRVELGNTATAWQTEGICFYNETSTHRIFISCEVNTTPAGIYSSDIHSIVGIKENLDQTTQLKIFPNPSSGIVEIESDGVITEVEILTSDGRSIYSKTYNQTHVTLNCSNFTTAQGCYILKIQTAKQISFHKLFLTN